MVEDPDFRSDNDNNRELDIEALEFFPSYKLYYEKSNIN